MSASASSSSSSSSGDASSEDDSDDKERFASSSSDDDDDDDERANTAEKEKEEELFYDSNLDDKDEKFIRKRNNTDAILSCPACFSTVCTQCQQHLTFDLQYRAIESFGTKISTSEVLKDKRSSFKGRKVVCEACEETVAIIDEENVYHFFNVIPSN